MAAAAAPVAISCEKSVKGMDTSEDCKSSAAAGVMEDGGATGGRNSAGCATAKAMGQGWGHTAQ